MGILDVKHCTKRFGGLLAVKDLNLSEAALLAGLIRQPSVNDPRTNPAGAESVRMQVLGQMRDQGRISEAEYSEAATQRLVLLGETDAAIEHLGIALEGNPSLAAYVAEDKDLASLRDDSRFGKLLG